MCDEIFRYLAHIAHNLSMLSFLSLTNAVRFLFIKVLGFARYKCNRLSITKYLGI